MSKPVNPESDSLLQQLNIRVTEEMLRELETLAFLERLSPAEVVRGIVKRELAARQTEIREQSSDLISHDQGVILSI